MMKKFMKKLWDKRDSKKGFTLVELIVVLVILAILAAIMVPALLGWINKARDKQTVVNGRTAYMAAMTLMTEEYGKNNSTTSITIDNDDIANLAGVTGELSGTVTVPAGKSAATTVSVTYTEGTISVIYNGTTWDTTTTPADGSGVVFTITK